jgi:hypothetical protein
MSQAENSTITRRSIMVAGTAALPATVLAASTAPDPIFAVIEAHRAAYDNFVAILTPLDEAEFASMGTRADAKPRALVGHAHFKQREPDPIYRETHEEIHEFFDGQLAAVDRMLGMLTPDAQALIEQKRANAHAELDRDEADIAEAKERCHCWLTGRRAKLPQEPSARLRVTQVYARRVRDVVSRSRSLSPW